MSPLKKSVVRVLSLAGIMSVTAVAQNFQGQDFICGTDSETQAMAKTSASNEMGGTIRVMVFRVGFPDIPYSIETSDLESTHKGVSQFFADNSYGKLEMIFVLYPETWVAPEKGEHYVANWSSFTTWISDKLDDEGLYKGKHWDRYIVSFPQIDLDFSGLSRGISKGSNFANGRYTSSLVAHEMGHALGLPHATALDAAEGIFGIPGTMGEKLEYGDPFDVMGGAGIIGHFNSRYKEHLGWMGETDVIHVNQSGVYRIYAHDSPYKMGNALAMRIESGDSRYTYWVEYRTSYNVSSNNARKGVGIRLEGYFTTRTFQTALLDMTPRSQLSESGARPIRDFNDANLEVGKTFDDKYGRFTVTPLAINEGVWVDLQVIFHGEAPDWSSPVSVISPRFITTGGFQSGILAEQVLFLNASGRLLSGSRSNPGGMIYFHAGSVPDRSPRLLSAVK